MIHFFGLFFIPIALMVIWSVFGEISLKAIENLYIKFSLLALGGVAVSYGLTLVIKYFSAKTHISQMNFGNWKALLIGCALGLVVSLLSGYLFHVTQNPDTDFGRLTEGIGPRFIGNISPAVIEEVVFRGGIVHSVTVLWGEGLGLASGSIPFGLIHLIGRLLGKPVGLWHVLGVTAAGLLLSVAYLKFGLLFAIGVHWIWNSLCGTWVTVFGLPKYNGVQMIEGAWTTVLVLLCFTVILFFLPSGIPKINLSE